MLVISVVLVFMIFITILDGSGSLALFNLPVVSLNRWGFVLNVLSFIFLTPTLIGDNELKKLELNLRNWGKYILLAAKNSVKILGIAISIIIFGIVAIVPFTIIIYISAYLFTFILVFGAFIFVQTGWISLQFTKIFSSIVLAIIYLSAFYCFHKLSKPGENLANASFQQFTSITYIIDKIANYLSNLANDNDARNRWTRFGIILFFVANILQFFAS